MNRILALFAFVVLAAFLYILASKIGEIDVWIVTVLAAALAAYDFVTSSKNKS
ncbi:MAG: hypothetical protein ACU0AX_09300 [Roseovarius sp.]|uniref:hypothetical protein n=1 Tax=Roseovarius sp. TaxID=1486281 RepID=UPI004059055C